MVGIFSRFAAGRTGHRRTKSATETRGTQSSASMETGDESSTSTCKDNDNSRAEFKPIEHPLEPSNHDRPIRCPLPDPSILNDVMAGKERTSSSSIEGTSARTRADDGPNIPNSISEPERHLITAPEDHSNPARG
ncbi:uncharacterized protein LOC122016744 isoform X2 [Zingiber officinale]|uniref:uncharacterized protein LOC122016744 isoform X2 n=1 Tax=Zingiber officinale TaxID=94328 RepID=UPI001C4B4A1A|nr:uncharacterized protein LOC122016744 isoform X2 [Zingiber officinale]